MYSSAKETRAHGFLRGLAVLILLVLFLCVTFTGSGRAEETENLLENAAFTLLDEDGIPEEWYTDAYIMEPGYTNFSVGPAQGREGNALEINNLALNDARLAQMVFVEPDTLYRFSGWIRADHIEEGLGANLSIEGIYAFSESVYDTDGEWRYVEWYGETGPDQYDVTLFARVGGYSGESMGRAWFAGLKLEKADAVPGDGIAARWFTDAGDDTSYYDDEGDEGAELPGPAWPWLLGIALVYSLAFLSLMRYLKNRKREELTEEKPRPWVLALLFLLSLVLRCVLSARIDGYAVDVNDFRIWGELMLSGGPGQFYLQSGFCDYPPAYTWILGLNAWICRTLNTSPAMTQVVYRLFPNLCDLVACGLLAWFAAKKGKIRGAAEVYGLCACLAFNPAMMLNSAAWGQMDSVLCLLLLLVVMLAMEDRWAAALPVYVLAVLVKPQALLLGFLGLEAIVLRWLGRPQVRKGILIGVGLSLGALALLVIPFGVHQPFGWLIRLYSGTLGSYAYATINTANLYYLLGGNWRAIEGSAPLMLPLLLAAGCGGYAFLWWKRNREKPFKAWQAETALAGCFCLFFLVCALAGASWSLVGTGAMVFAFVMVLSLYLRKNDLSLLPYLGALVFILLYVFGLKMHERYLFPALLLLACAWLVHRDFRILGLLAVFSLTLFLNEGIILDNCIRLGAAQGHLNADTVGLADVLAVLNVISALYAACLGVDFCFGQKAKTESVLARLFPVPRVKRVRSPLDYHPDAKLHWKRKDTLLLCGMTLAYAAVSLTTLGSTKAPQTTWSSSGYNESVIFDLGEGHPETTVLYFAQVSRHDFSLAESDDLENWSGETYAQMDQGQCWKWKYVTDSWEKEDGERSYSNGSMETTVRFRGRYIRLTAQQVGLRLNEILFRTPEGERLTATLVSRTGGSEESELYSSPEALLDEQDTLEGLPDYFSGEEPVPQPSWWNSTYFDEIYHARTAWEFTQGTTPYETSHPPLGKVLMSWCVSLLGMTPFGWRFAGALAGILMLPGVYLLGKQLTGKTRYGAAACAVLALDCMHLTQTQIATIDSFPVLFILFAYFFMLRFLKMNVVKERMGRLLGNLGLSGLFMGLAVASKWIGVYAGLGLAVLFFWQCARTVRLRREAEKLAASGNLTEAEQEALQPWLTGSSGGMKADWKRIIPLCLWCVLFFVIVPLGIYLASYLPYMAYNHAIRNVFDYLEAVYNSQLGMLSYHSTPGLGMDHPFYSPWYEWPVIGKPMFYATEQYMPDNGLHTSIFCFGNPAIWWVGLGTVLCCLLLWLRQKRYVTGDSAQRWHLGNRDFTVTFSFLLLSLLAQYLPWVLVPRGTYIYHYFACVPFLVLTIGVTFDELEKAFSWKRIRLALWVYLLLCGVCFILLFPYASGLLAPEGWLNIGKAVLKIWY